VLKNVNTGESTTFKPLQGLKDDPRSMGFSNKRETDSDDEDLNDITDAVITVPNKGRAAVENRGGF
jgi:hypothetical protein